MNKWLDRLTDFKNSLIASAVLHIFLLLIFLVVNVGLDFTPADYAEITFVSSSRGRVSVPSRQPEARIEEDKKVPAVTPPPPPQQQEEAKAQPVNLPKRRMLEDTEPELTSKRPGKLTPYDTAPTRQSRNYDQRRTPSDQTPPTSTGKRIVTTPGQVGSNDETAPVQPAQTEKTGNANRLFTIEGDAADRTILNQTIPQYPSGLQKEAVVKIRFTVLPDGRIGQMIPLQKGEPRLEEITLEALRQWRFNPLPAGAEQEPVQGIITFRYELM